MDEINQLQKRISELEGNEDKFLTILKSISDGFFVLDTKELIVRLFNQEAENLLGKKAKDVIGKPLFEAFPEAKGSEFELKYREAYKKRKFVNFETYFGAAPYTNWYDVRVYPAKDSISVYFQVITKRKQVETELLKAGRLLNETEKTGNIGGWQFDPVSLKQTWTDQVFRILEIDLDHGAPEVPKALEFIDPKFRPMAEKSIQRAMEHGEPYDQEWMVTTARGNKKWVNAVCKPKMKDGKVVAISGSFQDITSKKIVEEELKKSEQRIKTVIDTSPFPIAVVDELDQNIVFWSKSAIQLFGHDPKTSEEWYELAYPNEDYRQEVIERWKPFLELAQKSTKAISTGEYEIHCKNGAVKICEIYAQFIPGSLIVTLNDITERKKSEEQLKAQNLQLSAHDQQLRAANQQLRAANQQLQASEQQLRAANQQLQANEQQLRATNQQLQANEQQLRATNQELHANEQQLIYAKGKAEESERKYRKLVETASDAIYLASEDGTIIDTNQGAINMLGKVRDEIVGESIASIDPNYPAKEFLGFWKDIPFDKQHIFESSHQHVNGDLIPVELSAKKYRQDDEVYYYSVARDITERKESEAELKKIEWLLQPKKEKAEERIPDYGDLTMLNQDRTILDSVGKEVLNEIVSDYLSLLDTSAAVYEKNGDYAVGIFSSEWCQFMDCSSRALCQSKDNKKALESGKWLCHESCWEDASKQAMQTDKAVDIECNGGLNIYAIPIKANNEVVAAINFGYGNPPTDEDKLVEIAAKYKVSLDKLKDLAHSYETRPAFIIDIAKEKLESSARFIGKIVEIKQMEEELLKNQKRYQKAEAIGNVGNWEYDPGSTYFWASDEAKKMYGFNLNADDFSTEAVESCIPERERVHQALVDLLEHNKKYDIVFDIITNDKGIRKTIHSMAEVERDAQGKAARVTGIVIDITRSKHVENELIVAKEKAEESDRLKSAFLANMSHEIRTPMNGILGFANLLKKPTLTGEQQQEFIEIIRKSGDRMLNTVNDIIDISRIESGLVELSLSEVNIHEQLEYLQSFFSLEAGKKGIQLVVENDISEQENRVITDLEKFNSIITNLIKNAIKYTNQGTIELGCRIEKENGAAEVVFYVEDTGIGIPRDRQEAIFDRFIQADIEDKQANQGSGLGLAISKAYAEMLGGKIWVDSEVGKGSIFYFSIQSSSGADLESITKDNEYISEQDNIKGALKILVVEDDETSKELVSIMLEKFAKKVLYATSGLEAVSVCRDNPDIDLIIMDIRLPGINGYEATQKIRQFNLDVVIIAQTAFALAGDKEKAIKMGCNEYISKPIIESELDALIKKYSVKFSLSNRN